VLEVTRGGVQLAANLISAVAKDCCEEKPTNALSDTKRIEEKK
jgi:hypothetical protein